MVDRDYFALRAGGDRARAVREMPSACLSRLLGNPDEWLLKNLDHPVKIDHESLIVAGELPLSDGPVRVACKRYRPRNGWKAFCGLFRPSRARRAWKLGRGLLAREIATARPLAICEIRRSWFRRTSYLFTEWIEAAENLHLYGWRLAGCPMHQRLQFAARCAESLGRLLGRMHAQHIAHRDLKGANLLVAQRTGAEGDVLTATYLIDLDGVRIRRHLSPARRAANLARLAAGLQAHPWVSRTLCCRFLRAYVGQFPPAAVAWKSVWREVAVRSRRLVQRKRRRREPVL